ncbi:MAG TPA: hypothetical protein VGR18_00605 [Rubrobacter sp.]|nr:hypothetical protein [Rubrobacter sp.]
MAATPALTFALLATGCLTLTNHSQSCTSSSGLIGPSEFSCSGTAETVKGEGSLTFDGEDDSDPDYVMDLTASVEGGRMDVFADSVDDGREGGEVSPGSPLRIRAVVPSSDEDVSVTLSVKGGEEAEVRGLAYEATFTEAE